jgi:hypothetical protein
MSESYRIAAITPYARPAPTPNADNRSNGDANEREPRWPFISSNPANAYGTGCQIAAECEGEVEPGSQLI